MPRLSPQDEPASVAHRAGALFRTAFGAAPLAGSAAPGRVNLIGDHVDYCGGHVLPMAIDRQTAVCAAPGKPGWVRAVSAQQSGSIAEVRLTESPAAIMPRWMSYPVGVIAHLIRSGLPVSGVDIAVASSIPAGAGLSSSAALEVATCRAVETLFGARHEGLELARLAQAAEHEYAGVPCGIMDQYAVVFGAEGTGRAIALLLDCSACTHRVVPIPADAAIVLIDSGVKHDLAAAAYADRRRTCERALAEIRRVAPAPLPESLRHVSTADVARAVESGAALSHSDLRRVRHVISENRRTIDAAAALESGDLAAVGRLMRESHASLRDDYEVSCRELDDLVEIAGTLPGVLGARMTGGGFGGCAVLLTHASAADAVVNRFRVELPQDRLVMRVALPSATTWGANRAAASGDRADTMPPA